MADVDEVLKRLRREFVKVNLLQAGLDAIILFLGLNLVLFLFGITISPAFSDTVLLAGAAAGVFFIDLAYRVRNYHLEIYEERNPKLHEILRTARDNPEADTFVERAMVDDLLRRLRSVTSDSIIPSRSIIQKILVVGGLSFLTLLSGLTSFQIQETGATILPALPAQDDDGESGPVLRNTSEIYGERSDISVADMDLGFNITGEGEDGPAETGDQVFESEDASLAAAEKQLSEDLTLAKQYSVAIKALAEK